MWRSRRAKAEAEAAAEAAAEAVAEAAAEEEETWTEAKAAGVCVLWGLCGEGVAAPALPLRPLTARHAPPVLQVGVGFGC